MLLPIEVCEHIISLVKNDHRLLRACALVCRAWLPSSRYHLFHTVRLRRPSDLDLIARTLTESSHLGTLVEVLDLYYTYRRTSIHVISAFPGLLAGHLPRLESLSIEGFHSAIIPPSFPDGFFNDLAQFHSVTRLNLLSIKFNTLSDLYNIICALPSLSVLTCRWLSWIPPFPWEVIDPETFKERAIHLKITHLHIDVQWNDMFISWYLYAVPLDRLDTIVFPRLQVSDIECVGALLCKTGPSLRHLTIGFSDRTVRTDIEDGVVEKHINLTENTDLESLCILSLNMFQREDIDLGWAHIVLAQLDRLCCEHVDRILAAHRFASLEALVFKSHINVEWLRSEIPGRFPLAHGKGFVVVEAMPFKWQSEFMT
ncbi:hypothetical protein B0H21DRAFT_869953 [Amylocystis lapponica]|nr:hypothetical protein B0H21DRAFT_869953 [Amylocystis lapponica]